jgi:putative PIN family toxin of toxin-antitoxin system
VTDTQAQVVIDTNVWLDLYVFRNPGVLALADALASGTLRALRCREFDAEIATVLIRPAIAKHADAESLDAAWRHWHSIATPTSLDPAARAPWICRDPDDQKFLDLAWQQRCAWLFSKDKAVLALAKRARHQGLVIASPACATLHAAQT